MQKISIVFIFALVAIICANIAPNVRLVKIGDNTKTFIHESKLEDLYPGEGKLTNFVDMTETPFLEEGEVPTMNAFPEKPTQQAIVKPMIEKIDSGHSEEHLLAVAKHLSSYRTRSANSDTGVQAVHWLKAEYEKRINALPPARKALFSVALFNHTSWKQPSLIVKMKGTSDEIVVIGGHIDSTASGGVAPGADDDASGSSTVLEAFTILAKYSNYVPKKSIEWHAYAAEEMGLLGSRAIAQNYKSAGKKVFAMAQFDMTGYNPRNTNKIGVITNGVNSALTEFSQMMITEYGKIGFVRRTLFGGTSDHASWQSAGYRACFPFEAVTNPHIHTARDTVDQLDFKNAIEWVKLAVSMSVELSQ